ncbi:MAG: DNA-formamidopyrimidine glycosylase family protein [Acidobacteriota bacterium]
MPELPDVAVYVECIAARVVGETLDRIVLGNPFVLRSVTPRPSEVEGRRVTGVSRLGKRIVLELEDDAFVVIHLMVAGRFQWKERPQGAAALRLKGRNQLAAFDFSSGRLQLTEAGTKRRASIHLAQGAEALAEHDRGGLEPLEASFEQFCEVLDRENHTLKRTLTDPRLYSGIGNAYSDEILLRARLSPMKWSTKLNENERRALYRATQDVLVEWTDRLRAEVGDGFPKKVTAFRPEMAVHGKYKEPCPDCSESVQRIVYAENECNYCAACQTGGRLLADRALSRLLRKDWPKTVQELEERRGPSES